MHRLVLRGDAPQLAAHYPSVGGTPGDAWPAFVAVLRDHRDELRRLVENPVQTNEPGTSRRDVRLLLAGEDRLLARAGYHGDLLEWPGW